MDLTPNMDFRKQCYFSKHSKPHLQGAVTLNEEGEGKAPQSMVLVIHKVGLWPDPMVEFTLFFS